jgi:hypothetical protein
MLCSTLGGPHPCILDRHVLLLSFVYVCSNIKRELAEVENSFFPRSPKIFGVKIYDEVHALGLCYSWAQELYIIHLKKEEVSTRGIGGLEVIIYWLIHQAPHSPWRILARVLAISSQFLVGSWAVWGSFPYAFPLRCKPDCPTIIFAQNKWSSVTYVWRLGRNDPNLDITGLAITYSNMARGGIPNGTSHWIVVLVPTASLVNKFKNVAIPVLGH